MTPPTLTTERLVLRPAQESDFAPLAAMWGDEEVVRYIGGQTRGPQDVWFTIARGRGMWDIKGFGNWTVTDGASGEVLGEAGFADFRRGITPDLSQWPEAGWAFSKSTWGRGIASEAVGAIHAWLDDARPGLSVCIVDEGNAASRRVAEKCGYRVWCQSELRGAAINIFRRGKA
ncbi:MAG: GNAT family N-acetyltransferase [Hyphomonas sp.]